MCEPTTWIMIAGLVLTAAAGVQTADAQKKAGEAQAEQAAENAKAAKAQGESTVLAAQIEEDRRRQQTRQMLASQRAGFAANNVDMSTGSAMDILGDTAMVGEQDALTIRANAARQAWGYSVDANNSMNQGRMAQAAGKNAATGTYLTTAASMWQQGSSMYGNRAPASTTTNRMGASRGAVNKGGYYSPGLKYS